MPGRSERIAFSTDSEFFLEKGSAWLRPPSRPPSHHPRLTYTACSAPLYITLHTGKAAARRRLSHGRGASPEVNKGGRGREGGKKV